MEAPLRRGPLKSPAPFAAQGESMNARLPVLAAVLLSLMGCASLSYQEPQQGSRARVRFVTTSTAPTVLRAYDDAGCTTNETIGQQQPQVPGHAAVEPP